MSRENLYSTRTIISGRTNQRNRSYKSYNEINKEVSECHKVSRSSFYGIKNRASEEHVTNNEFQKKQRQGVTLKISRKIKYNDFVRSAIRIKVHDFFRDNIPLTIDVILNVVHEDHLPTFKRTTF